MKTLGIIGGTGPESTIEYYQKVISKFQEKMHSKEVLPELFIYSINMYKIFDLLTNDRQNELVDYLADAAGKLEQIGADVVIMAANTPHIVFDEVQQRGDVQMISIIEETYLTAEEMNLNKTGLIGTKFTMEHDFFKKPFRLHNREIFVPDESDQQYIHKKTVEELENGIVREETKEGFLSIINEMVERDGIEGIILGCTEHPMLIKPDDLSIPVLNTTAIHINKIAETLFSD